MYLIFTASSDNYITNKIISSVLSASDANVGQASTLDLYKLYDETAFSGFTGSFSKPTELSRLLIKFDTTAISQSIKPFAELDGFSCYLQLRDINGSQVAPKDFNVIVYPLSQSFEEGVGKDIYSFNDLGRSNWYTASYTNDANVLWNLEGARMEGYLGSSDIDVIGSGSIAGTETRLYNTQYFQKGTEDLFIDVTTQVSATMAGFIPDHGFLVAFSGSEETDAKTRFVKRFGSRHTRSPYLRPALIVSYDDSQIDGRSEMVFNRTGSLFLTNHSYGFPANLISGSAASEIQGANSLAVIFHTGSWAVTSSGGQYSPANKHLTGIYSTAVAFDEFNTDTVAGSVDFATTLAATGSVLIHERWMDASEKVTFYTGSFRVKKDQRYAGGSKRKYEISVVNQQNTYKSNEIYRVRLFVRDSAISPKPARKAFTLKSLLLKNAYYQVRDKSTSQIFIPFRQTGNSTKISVDNEGMYFDFSTQGLAVGRSYTFDIKIILGNKSNVYNTTNVFRIENNG